MNPNLAVEWREEQPTPVPITQPVYPLDTFEGLVFDALRRGEPTEPIIRSEVDARVRDQILAALKYTFGCIDNTHNRPLAHDQMRWLFGIAQAAGETIVMLADRHGITKQAFLQGVNRLGGKLGVERKTCTAQSPAARERMRLRNHRGVRAAA